MEPCLTRELMSNMIVAHHHVVIVWLIAFTTGVGERATGSGLRFTVLNLSRCLLRCVFLENSESMAESGGAHAKPIFLLGLVAVVALVGHWDVTVGVGAQGSDQIVHEVAADLSD